MFDSWILINRSQMHSLDISPTVCRWAMTSAWSQPLLRWTVTLTVAGLLPQTRWSWLKTRVRLSPTLLRWRTPELQFLLGASWNEDLCGMRVLDLVLVLNELTGYFERLVICYFFSRTFVPIFLRIQVGSNSVSRSPVQSLWSLAPYDRWI